MAKEFEFETVSGTGTIDLLDPDNNDISLIEGSYTQQVTTKGEWVRDSFRTIATGATDAAARTAIKGLEKLLQDGVDWFKYPTKTASTWLRVKGDTETARRTLIKDWYRQDLPVEKFIDPVVVSGATVISEWKIDRHPDWEDVSAQTVSSISMSANGGVYNWGTQQTQLSGGTEVGRIANMTWGPPTTEQVYELWAGISEGTSITTADALLTVVQAEGTEYDRFNGTTNVTDGVSGTCAQTAFTGTIATIARRFANHRDALENGQYILLLRARITGSGEAMMRAEVGTGYTSDFTKIRMEQLPDVYVTSQEWLLYEMGVVDIPGPSYRYENSLVTGGAGTGEVTFILTAERISGTMELRCDEWILIPYEHFIYADRMDDTADAGATVEIVNSALTQENDIVEFVGGITGEGTYQARFSIYEMGINDWSYPRNGGTMVSAFNVKHPTTDTISHISSKTSSISLKVFRRWKSFR